MTPRTAACITGVQRGATEVFGNVREALLRTAGPRLSVFGVRPPNASWALIEALLPLERVALQRRCYSDAELALTISWLHCDMRTRAGDCRKNFLQQAR